ncbi:unnamed protein product [Allacma fusca]|uniref:DNA-directed RNA polymerase III subunit RPC6 n=1 Tax=Allacma fusca TaxID=39272 RepID=A0A8J2JZR7_9HEXA|nr:unnamed protein product [Allacma fusca]
MSTDSSIPSTSGPSSKAATPEDKKEKLSKFERRIIELAETFPKGIPDKIIQSDMPEVQGAERAAAINNLIEMGILDLYKQGNELLYKIKIKGTETSHLKNADKEERVVYEIIKEAANKGIWIKDIRFKSNLNQTQLNKILKILEGKRLIKPVKSVAANKKKVYMLFELEPDRSVTGGAWYSDQDFESEFVSILNQQCLRYLREKLDQSENLVEKIGPRAARYHALTKIEDVCNFISNLRISKVELTKDDIECILETLIYDAKIERIVKGDSVFYVAVNSFLDTPGLARTPCGICPVFKECTPNGLVNPKSYIFSLLIHPSKKARTLKPHFKLKYTETLPSRPLLCPAIMSRAYRVAQNGCTLSSLKKFQ